MMCSFIANLAKSVEYVNSIFQYLLLMTYLYSSYCSSKNLYFMQSLRFNGELLIHLN